MTTSMNEREPDQVKETKGAFADGLTLVRVLLTPLIMVLIIKAWGGNANTLADVDNVPLLAVPVNLSLLVLACILFAIAALTDVMDDFVGGSAQTNERTFGWLDDIADSVLVAGTLLALAYVNWRAGALVWTFVVPLAIILIRDISIALTRGYELSKFGFQETRLGDFKSALSMLAALILVGAPWLSNLAMQIRAKISPEDLLDVYGGSTALVWNTGLFILWVAAILSLITGYRIFQSKPADEAA